MGRSRHLFKSHFVRRGLPFLTLIVGGSFLLKEYATLRYQFRKSEITTAKEIAEKTGIKAKEEPVTLENIYDEMKKEDIDTWVNIRGPRPWEDSKTVQDLQREKASS
ncbi:cytochrome c oxidase assembly protein COX16 homolog, mitochondrial-like [Octopus bimaculoides]|uniref:Cytochrome c oxidase assembly protein COX16 homolog, mitochondrial n=1 Tax=Octopus bimaculoides TaxID=37653 RepID=A0A0L8GQC3_OCTBM|nr:cytochrome c oxidase assembly protein COX16 homolog, mitochondrial-like [Octopus bimaculoides]|eukprot:XP_014778961.1 PREDICTED: cytochrome c oxidase assembly protein COX16 homolog, mitochondrial-like [Octopus bimaculoides]